MKDNSGPAFPTLQTVNVPTYHPGLTKREYFAAMAMQGMTMWELKVDGTGYDWEKLAAWSFKMADAMLAAIRVGYGVNVSTTRNETQVDIKGQGIP